MKKIILLTISILMVTVTFARQGNPIPSYRVPISNKAYFVETISVSANQDLSKEKRDMNVSNDGSAGNGNTPGRASDIIVQIFNLKGDVVLGPFVISSGQTLTVPIDGSGWGVSAEAYSPTYVSVWTSDDQQ